MALLHGPIPHPNLRASPLLARRLLPSLTGAFVFPIAKGGLTITGKTVTLSTVAASTKVSIANVKQRWNGANFASKSGIGYSIHKFNHATQAVGILLAEGTAEVTDGSGLLEIDTSQLTAAVGDTALVVIWQLGGGPLGEDILGCSFETLVAGP